MRIYFAAPLFNDAEQRFNAELTRELESRGHSVFLPQRDGFEIAKGGTGEGSVSATDRRRAIFARDQSEVFAADLLLAVLDGRVPDEGVAVEIGLAWAHRDGASDPRPSPHRRTQNGRARQLPARRTQPHAQRSAGRAICRHRLAARLDGEAAGLTIAPDALPECVRHLTATKPAFQHKSTRRRRLMWPIRA